MTIISGPITATFAVTALVYADEFQVSSKPTSFLPTAQLPIRQGPITFLRVAEITAL
jgi:hypothetical protein